MEARALHALELPKVLAYLAGFTVSEAGYQACLDLRPYASLEKIRHEAELFEQGRLWVLHTESPLAPFPAIEGLLRFAAGTSAVLDLDELFALRQVLVQGRQKVEAMTAAPAGNEKALWPLWVERCRNLPMPLKSAAALVRCLSDDGFLRDEASPELSLARGELRRLHQQCSRKVKEYAVEYNILQYLQDSFMTLSSDRYVLPLKSNFKGRLQGVVHEYSQTGETCYFEPMFLVELNNRLQGLKREEREEERKILLYLSDLVRMELEGIRALYAFLADLDLLFARSALADCYDGRIVEFAPDRGLLLREARHPLLALAASPAARQSLRAYEQRRVPSEGEASSGASAGTRGRPAATGFSSGQDGEDEVDRDDPKDNKPARVVSSTLELLPGQRVLVISGGNAGGKTVCLKTVGLTALMGLCVLPAPVEAGSVLPPWTRVHAFIGDEQSLDDHVSTYTAQITHLGRIWPALGPDRLVILDEFGAGTDPSQGVALAQAVIDCLLECGTFVAAATHFPGLKAYALSTPGVRAASVLFDPKTKKPLFRLAYDQVGASQALDVAREHGLPERILRRAEQYLLINGEDSTALVERLNALAVAREGELALLAREKAAFAEKRRALRERFEKERAALFAAVQADAQKVLADWKASRVSHKQALKELSRIRALALTAGAGEGADGGKDARPELDLVSLSPRQPLRHIPWKRTGVLLEVDMRKKRLRLDFDGVSLWADASDVELPEKGEGRRRQDGEKKAAGATNAVFGLPVSPLLLDVRGMRADAAIRELQKFLDSAILSGRDTLEVVHGRGTGALRREVHAFLNSFPAACEYRLAPEDRGGDGMTIVELT